MARLPLLEKEKGEVLRQSAVGPGVDLAVVHGGVGMIERRQRRLEGAVAVGGGHRQVQVSNDPRHFLLPRRVPVERVPRPFGRLGRQVDDHRLLDRLRIICNGDRDALLLAVTLIWTSLRVFAPLVRGVAVMLMMVVMTVPSVMLLLRLRVRLLHLSLMLRLRLVVRTQTGTVLLLVRRTQVGAVLLWMMMMTMMTLDDDVVVSGPRPRVPLPRTGLRVNVRRDLLLLSLPLLSLPLLSRGRRRRRPAKQIH
mmetsp:Transcript_45626/g.84613  ORF Transcript_45626/g.84613 Transcript_45626/m.84613 type:complete len:252 (+) Transcript_45626:1367-2122(+)